jgi:signal transduction histidine kinase
MDFSRNSGFTCVDYSDDGSGFDFTAITSGPFKGFGVQNIMNRVHALQGSVEITSQPGKGMTARIKIPE